VTIDNLDFDEVAEGDIIELLFGQIPEGLRFDYKRELYGNSDADKREILKDVSGFANAFGGHLIIGVEESAGLPVGIPGIANTNPDEVVLRLEQIIRTGLEPRIQGLRVRAIPLSNGAHCFVLRIPRSWFPPHRVSAQNSNRFWIRNSGGTHEASMDELRSLFTLGADALRRALHFRDERLKIIKSGQSARPLLGDGRLILHIIPLAAVTSPLQVDLKRVYQLHRSFLPISSTGMSPRFNFEGFINERGGDQNYGYTQVFRNGAIEATKASIVRTHEGTKFIPSGAFEKSIFNILSGYLNGLRDVGIPPPLVVLLTLEAVKGVRYRVKQNIYDIPEPIIEQDLIFLPECLINEYGPDSDYHREIKPAIDALWNAAGFPSANTYSRDGVWVGGT
jgi:Putative DNA-binding domain